MISLLPVSTDSYTLLLKCACPNLQGCWYAAWDVGCQMGVKVTFSPNPLGPRECQRHLEFCGLWPCFSIWGNFLMPQAYSSTSHLVCQQLPYPESWTWNVKGFTTKLHSTLSPLLNVKSLVKNKMGAMSLLCVCLQGYRDPDFFFRF